MNENEQTASGTIDVKYYCGMRYSIVLGADGPKFEEHPRCKGTGIVRGIDREDLERSRKAESNLTVECPECGTLLNWFSGHFEEITQR